MDMMAAFNTVSDLLILMGTLGLFMRIRTLERKLDELFSPDDDEDEASRKPD